MVRAVNVMPLQTRIVFPVPIRLPAICTDGFLRLIVPLYFFSSQALPTATPDNLSFKKSENDLV
jgi:hypothetical protein